MQPTEGIPLEYLALVAGGIMLLSPTGHFLNKTTPSRLGETAGIPNTLKKKKKKGKLGKTRKERNMFQQKEQAKASENKKEISTVPDKELK